MDNTARNRVLEQIPYFSERMGRHYTQNAEYKESVKKADLIIEKLDNSLDDTQAELLEQYFIANNITAALTKKLIYQQGRMDLLDLLLGGKEFDICNNH